MYLVLAIAGAWVVERVFLYCFGFLVGALLPPPSRDFLTGIRLAGLLVYSISLIGLNHNLRLLLPLPF